MAADDDNDAGARTPVNGSDSPTASSPSSIHRHRMGMVSRLWRGLFGEGNGHDYEKMLQQLAMKEATVRARLKRRSQSSNANIRNLIAVSIALEVTAISYAIMSTREMDLNWQLRALRVLPMFLIPALSAVIYSALVSIKRIFDTKDQQALEKLQASRQAEIDELKERTKYYTTQQLIQKYDIDPAAKAAAATVLASRLGSDSGLKVYLGDESNLKGSSRKSFERDMAQPTGLRQRRPLHDRNNETETGASHLISGTSSEHSVDDERSDSSDHRIGHPKSSNPIDGGWLARIAALLVGEDPTQCYALICSNCYMHNGLVKREDFDYITYYCPHCHALNGSRHAEEHEMGSVSGKETSSSLDANNSHHEEHKTNSVTEIAAASDISNASKLPKEQVQQELGELAS